MAFVNVTTSDGVLVERIDTSEYDLDQTLARAALAEEVLTAVESADADEK